MLLALWNDCKNSTFIHENIKISFKNSNISFTFCLMHAEVELSIEFYTFYQNLNRCKRNITCAKYTCNTTNAINIYIVDF